VSKVCLAFGNNAWMEGYKAPHNPLTFNNEWQASDIGDNWTAKSQTNKPFSSLVAFLSEQSEATTFSTYRRDLLAWFISFVDERSVLSMNVKVGSSFEEIQFDQDISWNEKVATVLLPPSPKLQISLANVVANDPTTLLPSEIEEKLSELKLSCSEDNWDGEGAYAIELPVIERVREFLSLLSTAILKRLDETSVSPNPDGTISVRFPISMAEFVAIFGSLLITAYTVEEGKIVQYFDKLTTVGAIFEKIDLSTIMA